MKLIDLVRKAFGTAEAEAFRPTEARTEAMPTYSRHRPNPAWGDKRPSGGDRVVGRQVVGDGPVPPGERIALNEWTAGNIESRSNEIGADFFAAWQALANRRER